MNVTHIIHTFAQSIQSAPINPFPDPKSDSISIIANIVFGIIGALCLFMVVFGGFKYTMSKGNADEVAKAKNTIVYAFVGLVVSVAAVTIVSFFLDRIK